MKSYNEIKDQLRNHVIELQHSKEIESMSYGELMELSDKLYKVAKKYGLIKEFKENGVL